MPRTQLTGEQVAATSIPVGDINATGTPSSTTFLRGDGTWNAPAAGTTYTPLNTLTVASSTASAAEKASANYVCDGTADEVEINTALTALQTKGGQVLLSGGTFNLAATIAITGGTNFADNVYVELTGMGADTTTLAPASGIHAITLTSTPKPGIKKMRINLSGTSDGIRCIAPTTGANDRRGFWMGAFEDLKIQGDFSTSTGWAINMEAPFRSTFKRIQALGVKNGIWLKSSYVNFNPGNLTFDDCHMDLSQPNGTAYFLDTADTGGFFNICTFMECDCIDSNGTSTTSIGWRFKGSTTSYFTTRDLLILRSNVELFNTAVSLEHSANVEFNGNYIDTKTGGTIFSVTADSPNNQLSVQYAYVPNPKTTKVLNDLNTDPLKPTTLRNSFARVETGGTLSITKSAATVLSGLYRDSDGTGVYPAEWQGQTAGINCYDEAVELFRGTRAIKFVGAGVTATNTGPDITVTIPGSAGGTNATNLTTTAAPTNVTINSDTGTDAIIAATDATNAGLLLPAEKTKLTNTSGTNTGDQTTITGNAGTATALQTARTINGEPFDGTANITIADATKEPTITAGTTAQYYRGDKSFQTLDKTAVGLANVDNTSDATKNSATATLTNKTLTAPVINNPSGFLTGAAKITVSTTAPAAPSAGDIWVDAA